LYCRGKNRKKSERLNWSIVADRMNDLANKK